VDEYAKVLTETEIKTFFGFDEGRRPARPMDLDQLKGPQSES
jgi:hypothetical protein